MRSVVRFLLRPLPFLLFLLVCGTQASSSAAAPQLATQSHPTNRNAVGGSTPSSCEHDKNFDLDDKNKTTRTISLLLARYNLQSSEDDNYGVGVDDQRPQFHVQGWRWHFMSLVRDSRRLESLAERVASSYDDEDLVALERAADYVVNFNMAALFRIQVDLSSKWLRDQLCDEDAVRRIIGEDDDGSSSSDVEVVDALKKLVDKLDEYRARSEKMGEQLYTQVKKATTAQSSSKTHHQTKQLLKDIVNSSAKFSAQITTMRSLHESLIVPAVSLIVPAKTQKSFSNKVLLSLGILESRLHLVGMHDAIAGIEEEERKFGEEIPYIARKMIGGWRKSLYVPKAGALDHGL